MLIAAEQTTRLTGGTDFYIDSFMKYDTFESRNIILEGQGVERI